MSERLELCRVCWWLGPTIENGRGEPLMIDHARPAVQGGRFCGGSGQRCRPNWDDCASRGCEHPPSRHPLKDEDDLPTVLCSAPCSVPGCECLDYDGMNHPERGSMADAWVYSEDDGGVGVV